MTNNRKIKPLPHQRKILKELKDKDFALVHSASGSGKTHIAAFLIKEQKPKSFLFIVHRNELVTQSIGYFKEVNGPIINDSNIGIINATKKQFDKPYIFGTMQTICKPENLEMLNHGAKWDYIIIDEFHHSACPSYRKILENLKFKRVLGLTATPFRTDKKDILQTIKGEKNVVGKIDIFTGIELGIMVPFHFVGKIDNFLVDWSDKRTYAGYKYTKMDMDRTLLIPERDKHVIKHYKEVIEPENVSTIGFCATIEHVKRMVREFKKAGIYSEGITYETPIEERQFILDRFRKGQIPILFAIDILNEGIDFPECGALMFLRPTQSRVIFEQQLGRGLRKDREGKKERLLVLDFLSNYEKVEQIMQYLKDITKQEKPIITQEGTNYTKPIHKQSYPTYEFESKVVTMLELKERLKPREYTKQELIDNYYEVKRKLASLRRK